LIVSMNRHEGRVVGAQVLNAALAHIQHGVVGIDLAGQEEGYSCEPFAAIFRLAKDLGLYTTVHAGEWVGAESVRAALDILHADRIGHGVRALDDPELLARLVEQQIPLEVCPTTNVHSGVVETFSVHPLPHLLSAGVMVTVNTDDPLISNVTLTDELRYSVSTFGLSWAQIQQLMLNAARAAFLPPSEREALVAKFQGWFAHD
jgi:adenosine deaminase